jgi:aminoglycoside phosphotransferase (APT) family kinase protein
VLTQRALSINEIVPWLLRRGLLEPSVVVSGKVRVSDVSQRARTFLVERGGSAGFVLRQADRETASREAAIYGLLEGRGPPLPRLLAHEPDTGVLVFDLPPGSRNLRQRLATNGAASPNLLAALGRALRALHQMPADRRSFAVLPPPDVLRLHRPTSVTYRTLSRAGLRLAMIVASEPSLAGPLARLEAGWRASALIHGDMRLSNVVGPAEGSDQTSQTRLIDWETTGIGDPTWDVGGILSELLSCQVGPAPVPAQLHDAARAFWAAWNTEVEQDGSGALQRAMAYAAARLIQTAIEEAQLMDDYTERSILLLQLAVNTLVEPIAGAKQLLGLTARRGAGP